MNLSLCVIFGFLVCCFSAVPLSFGSSESNNNNSKVSPNPIEHLEGLVNYFKAAEERNREQEKVMEELKVQFKKFQSAQETCQAEVKSLTTKVSQLESRISEDRGVCLMTPPLRGPPGKDGEKGANGEPGQNGAQGPPGKQGDPGPKGDTGETGQNGQDGKDGSPGRDGTNGVKGAAGKDGEKGDQGLPGISGKDGTNGKDGTDGSPGRNGTDGVKGPKGDRGLSAHQPITSCSVAMEALPSPRSKKQTIYPNGNNKSLEVFCDFESDGGGWTVIQKRSSGPKEEFQKTWNEYQNRFGSLEKNFWIGLENIHALTKNGDQELRIELEDHEGNKRWAKYSSFSVSNAYDSYALRISGFSGTANDSMTNSYYYTSYSNNRMRFSTKDKYHDNWSGPSCVQPRGDGGWWFNDCGFSSLNGLYFEKGETVPFAKGIYWVSWKGWESLAKTEMKIRTRKSE